MGGAHERRPFAFLNRLAASEPVREGALQKLEIHGNLAVMLEQPENRAAISMVAGPGLEPGTYGL